MLSINRFYLTLILRMICIGAICFSLSACQWGGQGTDDDENTIDGDTLDTNVNIDINTEAGDIFSIENNLYEFTLLRFNQDINNEKNSHYSLFFDQFQNAESSVAPDDDEDQSSNDVSLSQTTWNEELFSESYNIEWLNISSPYNIPGSNYALTRSYQTLQLTGINEGQLSTIVNSRNYPLIEAIRSNIFEYQLGATFIWDLDGLGDINKKEDLNLDKFSDYETYDGRPLLENASIWGDNERFSNGALLYSGIKQVNAERVVVESLLNNSEYTIAAASFDGTGKTINDIPADYDIAGGSKVSFSYTLDFINEYTVYLSFDANTSRAFYHESESGDAIASSPYSVNNAQSLLTLDAQNLTAEPTAGTLQAELLEQLNLTAFFNPAIVGPFKDENNAERYYYAKHFIAATDENRPLQQPVFYFNGQAFEDIKAQFINWRDEILDDAY